MDKILDKLKAVEELMGKLFLAHVKSDSGKFVQIQREINKELFSIRLEIITSTAFEEEDK